MVALDEHFRHSATAVRTHWHPIGKSVPSAQSVDHVPTLAARPLFTSATSVVNINGPGTRATGWHFGTSESSQKDHRSLATDRRADGFGNALGFTPSTAITQYLYTQQYYDLFNNTYYDWARNYDPMAGMFDQADYGYSGSLSNPMSYLPYTFTGGDPINLSDFNGHDFSLTSVVMNIAIGSMLSAIISPVVAPLVESAASMLIPQWVTNTILHSAADALIGGMSLMGNVPAENLPVGVVGGFGIEGLWSPFTDNAAVYGYVGAGLSFGSSTESATLAGTVGAVWRTPSSKDYKGPFVTLSIPFASLQQALQQKIEFEIA